MTMDKFNNILVVLEANSDTQPALERARHFAESNNQCSITVRLGALSRKNQVTQGSDTEEAFNELLKKNCIDYISPFIEPLKAKGIEVNISLGWGEQPFEGIIRKALEIGAQLVIKSSKLHSKIKNLLFTPTDWHLLRKCPVPVLLVHSSKPEKPKHILAAVSSVSIDDEHLELDHKVIEHAVSLGKMFQAQVKLINAYSAVPLGISLDGAGIYQDEYLAELQKQHHQKTLLLAKKYGIEEDSVETRQGEAHTVICEYANEKAIDLVILGTVARQGLTGILIGNTVEQILDDLECAVLTLKQDNFECPYSEEKDD